MARPKHLRRGRYRMTPARRAALKKAQTASAKKRRRLKIAKGVGKTAINLGGMFVAVHATKYITNPRSIGKDYKDLKQFSAKVNRRFFGGAPAPVKPSVSKNLKATMSWIP